MLLLPTSVTWHASQTHSYAQRPQLFAWTHVCVLVHAHWSHPVQLPVFCVFTFLLLFFLCCCYLFFVCFSCCLHTSGRSEFFSFFNGLFSLIMCLLLFFSFPSIFLHLGAITVEFLFYSSLFNCLLLHSSCEGCRVFPAQLLHSHTHRHAHDDGPVHLACCTHAEGPRRTAR
ncbi:hypothetical protein TCDM_09699 [Trypanosoma cruzi Dm28c]|uniref:Uncharacterized protein n=1 Tax=Trypanosoma cruzi Dm28c TaxID=1416333 RepID=V5D593_TRYCR|nr:hypothetical protein TCDM_09699 [Trypanosoma cruzi Dm28c]